ncbi:endo alpha-1,4 polygalactosaminidase [Humidisolicoccus flavus]|uniref:endo alpha-1,4 polygalactosaminidase n=1 Tax=Humidisolicoccus flavus TaxID=3111414 RepID=UPI00324B02A1
MRKTLGFLAVLLLVSGCTATSQGGAPNDSAPSDTGTESISGDDAISVALPPTTGFFDYQLGGASTPDADGGVLARDSSDLPEPGFFNICYVNGFQTQPSEAEQWLASEGDPILRDENGEPVIDPEWPDEMILDPSTEAKRSAILSLMEPVLHGCAEAGFDAIEIDNLDTWTRFDSPTTGQIDEEGALTLARSYVEIAHGLDLAIGQKNAAELAEIGHTELGFDFAVTEECSVYAECGAYTSVYGEHVLQIEYLDSLELPFDEVCSDPDSAPLTILRDRDLTTPSSPEYFYEQCPIP